MMRQPQHSSVSAGQCSASMVDSYCPGGKFLWMNMTSNIAVQEFVSARFGHDCAQQLEHIARGGKSNKKGADFEGCYAVYMIASIAATAAPAECAHHHVSSQETAFVDDLCVRNQVIGTKRNYQAKNSDGSAADWTDELRARFEMQIIVDIEHHRVQQQEQVLVVSCADKAAANQKKIPHAMQSCCRAEYFPYELTSIALLMSHEPLQSVFAKLCNSRQLGHLDAAFRIILGQWHADNNAGRTVLDVLTKAKASARPDIFGGFHPPQRCWQEGLSAPPYTPPSWLTEVLDRFQMGVATVECAAFKVSYNGLDVQVAAHAPAPPTCSPA